MKLYRPLWAIFGLLLALAAFTPADADGQDKAPATKRVTSDDNLPAEKIAAHLAKQKKLPRGAKRTPAHKIAAAVKAGTLLVHTGKYQKASPPFVTRVPGTMSYLGNNQYGDCVTAESCFSMEAYSVGLGLPEIVISDNTAIAWATSHGVRDGADLLQVIQMMQQDGITATDGKLYKAGTPATVDFSNEATLQSAIAIGPVSLGIDANGLPSGAGSGSGWYMFGGSPDQFSNEDHDVDLCGYGTKEQLFGALNTPVPAGAPGGVLYLIYTWAGIGVTDHAGVMSMSGEAYVRTPTVVGLGPVVPPVDYVPPYFITEQVSGASRGNIAGYPDFASANTAAQGFADQSKLNMLIKDSTGAAVSVVTPTVVPIVCPPGFHDDGTGNCVPDVVPPPPPPPNCHPHPLLHRLLHPFEQLRERRQQRRGSCEAEVQMNQAA